jgi:putative chitinase
MDEFQVNTKLRMAAFIAQGMHESTKFTQLEENLYYTHADVLYSVFPSQFTGMDDAAQYLRNPKKLANHVYDLRNGNGNEASGDGWTFRGRGVVQLTGRGNYRAVDQKLGTDYEKNPDKVAQPVDACRTYGSYWMQHQCNSLADLGLIDAITKAINPAMRGAMERRQNYARAMNALA